jgi:hypothetical protein
MDDDCTQNRFLRGRRPNPELPTARTTITSGPRTPRSKTDPTTVYSAYDERRGTGYDTDDDWPGTGYCTHDDRVGTPDSVDDDCSGTGYSTHDDRLGRPDSADDEQPGSRTPQTTDSERRTP